MFVTYQEVKWVSTLKITMNQKYITIRGKGPVVKDLKKHAKKAKKIFLASDPDREGEAIAWHLSKILELEDSKENRVVFNEITKDAVKDSFKHPRGIEMDLVDAQQARRILDRLVGYNISPVLWKKVKKRAVCWESSVSCFTFSH